MKIANQCVICENDNFISRNAIVVPFLADRIFKRNSFITSLIHCKNCDFQFYAIRLEDKELVLLYDNYRDDRYIEQRNKYEPWYTHRLNNRLFSNPTLMKNRRDSVIEQANSYDSDSFQKINTVLDFGGDKGQLLDGIFNKCEKYVFEISNVDLLPGIKKAVYPSPITFDFIICANVFEHVSYPVETLKIISEMAHDNTILYLEVPYEKPYSSITLIKRIIQQLMLLFFRPRVFISTFGRGMLTHMHEHVNYFSRKSLSILLENAGYKNISINVRTIYNAKFFCCLAKK